jgi:alkanesulfonate monooxygenase SsuD/methylene tetrahydromethanopterin reductase-like flavin-dependent oxidoreductase (luciferase family)
MLRITMPHADAWNTWFADTGNTPSGVGPLRDIVDEACRDVGRDPASVERTVAVQVRLTGGQGRFSGGYSAQSFEPLAGSPEEIADGLAAYTREGVSHLQLVLDPITRRSVEELGPVLAALERR